MNQSVFFFALCLGERTVRLGMGIAEIVSCETVCGGGEDPCACAPCVTWGSNRLETGKRAASRGTGCWLQDVARLHFMTLGGEIQAPGGSDVG